MQPPTNTPLPKIIVIDDDRSIIPKLELAFPNKYTFVGIYTLQEAKNYGQYAQADLILLDLQLSDKTTNNDEYDGEVLLRSVLRNIQKPIIIITAKNPDKDKIMEFGERYRTKGYLEKINYNKKKWEEKFEGILANRSINIYIHHKEDTTCENYKLLMSHIKTLQRVHSSVFIFDANSILNGGDDICSKLQNAVNNSQVILVIYSPKLLADDKSHDFTQNCIYKIGDKAKVIDIILAPCYYEDIPRQGKKVSDYLTLPRDNKPLIIDKGIADERFTTFLIKELKEIIASL